MEGQEVGLSDQILDGQQADAELGAALGGDEGVVGRDLHAGGLGDGRDMRADAAEADHAEGLAEELHAHVLGALPLAALGAGVGRGHVAREREHQRQGLLGGGDGVAGRRVDHHHTVAGGRGHVDVVDADAGAADDAEVLARLDDLGRDLGLRSHHQGVVIADDGLQLLGGVVGLDVHLGDGAQALEAGLVDRVADQHAERTGLGEGFGVLRRLAGHDGSFPGGGGYVGDRKLSHTSKRRPRGDSRRQKTTPHRHIW
ncbi:hypothetical protein D3C72_1588960 [compost metagenome]